MEYQKLTNLLDNTPYQPSKFKTRNWVEINGESDGARNTNSQIKFETSMLESSLCGYSDAYLHVKGTITTPDTGTVATSNNRNKNVIFKIVLHLLIAWMKEIIHK